MAAEEKEEVEGADEQPKKKSPIILIVVLVVVGLVLAVGISTFVMKQMMEDAASEEEFDDSKPHDSGIFIKLGDAKEGILVNVGGPRAGKYLKAGIVLEVNPSKKSVINEETHAFNPEAEIKVMDTTTQFLRSVQIEDFDAQKQNDLKKQLKEALNAELGNGAVYDVYITSFLLQ